MLKAMKQQIFPSSARLQLHMANEVILHLDVALDRRPLSVEEHDLHSRLKKRVVGLAILERSRKRQCSRVTNLREGDANTGHFHRKANGCRQKKFILASSTTLARSLHMMTKIGLFRTTSLKCLLVARDAIRTFAGRASRGQLRACSPLLPLSPKRRFALPSDNCSLQGRTLHSTLASIALAH